MFHPLITAITRAIQHVLNPRTPSFRRAQRVMEPPTNCTYLVFRYTDTETEDRIFIYPGHLRDEPLHSALDALIDEHYEPPLSTTIGVIWFDAAGNYDEEEITFELA